ncbi:MAG: DoxX family protein [Chloroflexota bacterium]|nr:DoxX family protein [Chloroflexota bacterium]
MNDLALLVLRLVTGGLLAGHGAQKLFGWFGGHGIEGTGGWLESVGLHPGKHWAGAGGGAELAGGALTALGLMNPIGPIVMLAPMGVAIRKVHWGKPVWATEGGAELPLTNVAVGTALLLTGPGAISLDRLFGVRVPWWVSGLALLATAAGVRAVLDEEFRARLERMPSDAREALGQAPGSEAQVTT